MNSIVRACGIAAAAVGCLTAATFADPLLASRSDAAPQISAVDAHSTATIVDPTPQTLDELVPTYANAQLMDAQQECLANAVYFEARGEPIDGQLAVAEVVLNRVASERYPDTICDVVTQPWQFSFIRKGRFPKADRGSVAWQKAVAISNIALGKVARKLDPDVLWYHAEYVAPSWRKQLKQQDKIGLHIFYS